MFDDFSDKGIRGELDLLEGIVDKFDLYVFGLQPQLDGLLFPVEGIKGKRFGALEIDPIFVDTPIPSLLRLSLHHPPLVRWVG